MSLRAFFRYSLVALLAIVWAACGGGGDAKQGGSSGASDATAREERGNASASSRTGDVETGDVDLMALGEEVYNNRCLTCHQQNGRGVKGLYPTLHGTEWVQGDKGRLIRMILHGVQGAMKVKGQTYQQVMSAHGDLSNQKVAAVLTYIRANYGNDASAVTPEEVDAVRTREERTQMWEARELRTATGIPESGSSNTSTEPGS